MRAISIKKIGVIMIAALAISGAVFVVSSIVIRTNVSNANLIWQQYLDESSPKARAIDALVTNLGFGGMIHQFKNYVLRQDEPRIRKILNAAGGSLAALDQYQASGVSDQEAQAIEAIRGVVNLYTGNLKMVQGLAEQGSDARAIDKSVKISDKPALEGIAVLVASIADTHQSDTEDRTKTEILSTMRSAMGYGGMIHNFKNFVLRQDEPRIAKVKTGVAGVRDAIAAYRELGVNETEDAALNDIESVMAAYDKNIDVAAALAKEGKTPEQIDQTVKISDGPALKGMAVLLGEIAAGNKSKRLDLSESLDTVEITSLEIMVVAILSSAALIALSFWAINRRIIKPIREITDTMGLLTEGKTDFTLAQADDDNEIGAIARAVDVFRQNKIQADELAEQQRQEQAVKERRAQAVEDMSSHFEQEVGEVLAKVSEASQTMKSTAEGMADTAEKTTERSTTVTSAAEQASANVQTVASAAEELSSSINEISSQVSQSSQIAGRAVRDAAHTDEQIQGLAAAASKIGEVVALITDIADQTNLLALNATIEAARAGEAGKGFAVVASEVKNLANQTAKATEEISTQISGVQSATQSAVEAIQGIGKTIGEIDEIAAAIASAVEEQGAATQEIARNVDQAASGTSEVTSNIAGVNQAAEETGKASAQVLEAVGTLATQSEAMSAQVRSFIQQIKEH